MLNMTWNDFKEYVDDALAKAGVDGSIEIEYFDFSYPSLDYAAATPYVAVSEDSLAVYN